MLFSLQFLIRTRSFAVLLFLFSNKIDLFSPKSKEKNIKSSSIFFFYRTLVSTWIELCAGMRLTEKQEINCFNL